MSGSDVCTFGRSLSQLDEFADDISILKGCIDWDVQNGLFVKSATFSSPLERSGTSIDARTGLRFCRFCFNHSVSSVAELL